MLGLWEDILGSSPQRPQDQIEISWGGGIQYADYLEQAFWMLMWPRQLLHQIAHTELGPSVSHSL